MESLSQSHQHQADGLLIPTTIGIIADKKKTNKWTMGKFLRSKKKLRKPESFVEPCSDPVLNHYVEYLLGKGVLAPKIRPALFACRNGLKYPGMVATETIYPKEDIVRLPRSLLLNTKKCYFSDVKVIFQENPWYFSSLATSSWEDRIFLVYLLHEHQKGDKSEWHQLLSNLSRDIDVVGLWKPAELAELQDPVMSRLALTYKDNLSKTIEIVTSILSRYPQFFPDKTIYSADNITWISVHLTTRCFGKHLRYVTMVPFCELLNHECSDVYYDFDYDDPTKTSKEIPDLISNEADFQDADTSTESYNSHEPPDEDNEYNYRDCLAQSGTKQQQKANTPASFFKTGEKIYSIITDELDFGDELSLFFASDVWNRVETIENAYNSGSLPMVDACNELAQLETKLNEFVQKVSKYKLNVLNIPKESQEPLQLIERASRKIDYKSITIDKMIAEYETKKKLSVEGQADPFKPESAWPEDDFDYFVMRGSSSDRFDANSQVFFCYGRLSNRLLLRRYGIALEYNKYDHYYITIDWPNLFKGRVPIKILKYVAEADSIPRLKRFKLKYTKFNWQTIVLAKCYLAQAKEMRPQLLFRPTDLDLELQACEFVLKIYEDALASAFKQTPSENEALLADPKTGYHLYFAVVYRLERQRILIHNINLVKVVIAIIKRLLSGVAFPIAILRVNEVEHESDYHRNRVLLKDYLERFVKEDD